MSSTAISRGRRPTLSTCCTGIWIASACRARCIAGTRETPTLKTTSRTPARPRSVACRWTYRRSMCRSISSRRGGSHRSLEIGVSIEGFDWRRVEICVGCERTCRGGHQSSGPEQTQSLDQRRLESDPQTWLEAAEEKPGAGGRIAASGSRSSSRRPPRCGSGWRRRPTVSELEELLEEQNSLAHMFVTSDRMARARTPTEAIDIAVEVLHNLVGAHTYALWLRWEGRRGPVRAGRRRWRADPETGRELVERAFATGAGARRRPPRRRRPGRDAAAPRRPHGRRALHRQPGAAGRRRLGRLQEDLIQFVIDRLPLGLWPRPCTTARPGRRHGRRCAPSSRRRGAPAMSESVGRALVVEDSPTMRQLITLTLRRIPA